MAVHGPAVAAADELDVAVRLVVAAADERRVVERSEMSIDEGPRPVVVDREEDDVSLADDRPDVGLVEELGDRLDGEPIVSCDPGQGLGLVEPRSLCEQACRDRFSGSKTSPSTRTRSDRGSGRFER